MRDGLRSWQTGALQQRVWSVIAQGAAPLVALALLCRAAKVARQTGRVPGENLSERFGTYSTPRPRGRLVWIHAVSVGEGAAAAPLVYALRAAHPQLNVLVSAGSADALEARLASPVWAPCDLILVPLDTPAAARAFLAHWQPCAAIFVESELWPNVLEEASGAALPVALVNARISATSARQWRLVAPLARRMLRSMRVICPANAAEEQALRKLCPKASFGPVGDLKAAAAYAGCAAAAPSALTAAILACRRAGRFVWVAASTHAGEEAEAATAHARLCAAAEGRRPLAIIVPRHPARAAAVVAELAQQHPSLRFALLSRDGAPAMAQSDAYVVDAFGILPELYAAASVAFVGNSLIPGGKGHNLAEAAAGSCVVLAGPYLWSGPFASMAEQLCAANAMSIVANAAELYAALSELRSAPDDCTQRGMAAAAASAQLAAGVLQRVFDAVNAALALDT